MQYAADLVPGGRQSVLAVGPPKTGKTLFAASFPEPYFASTDNRMMPVRTFKPLEGKKVAFDYFTEYPKLIKKLEELDRHCPFGTVVVDNLTFSGELAISYATGLTGSKGEKGRSKGVIALPTIEDWMGETEAIKDILNILVTLPCHIILIAHIMIRQTNNIKTGEVHVEQTLVSGAKRTASIVTGYFDEVYSSRRRLPLREKTDSLSELKEGVLQLLFLLSLFMISLVRMPLSFLQKILGIKVWSSKLSKKKQLTGLDSDYFDHMWVGARDTIIFLDNRTKNLTDCIGVIWDSYKEFERVRPQYQHLAEKEAEISRLRKSVMNQAGDNLCHLTNPETDPIPPKAEFLQSCERFWEQRASKTGELKGCMTIAQLERQLAENEAELGRVKFELACRGDVHTAVKFVQQQLIAAQIEAARLRDDFQRVQDARIALDLKRTFLHFNIK